MKKLLFILTFLSVVTQAAEVRLDDKQTDMTGFYDIIEFYNYSDFITFNIQLINKEFDEKLPSTTQSLIENLNLLLKLEKFPTEVLQILVGNIFLKIGIVIQYAQDAKVKAEIQQLVEKFLENFEKDRQQIVLVIHSKVKLRKNPWLQKSTEETINEYTQGEFEEFKINTFAAQKESALILFNQLTTNLNALANLQTTNIIEDKHLAILIKNQEAKLKFVIQVLKLRFNLVIEQIKT